MLALTGTITETSNDDIAHTSAPDSDSPATQPSHTKKDTTRKYRHVENSETFGYQPTPSHALPRPEPWLEKIICGVLESIHGVRDPRQFSRWVSRDVFELITARSQSIQRQNQALGKRAPRPQFNLRQLIIGQPRDGVVEASAVVRAPDKIIAVALRMEGVDNRWMTTTFQML
jgi:hypothetical protein